jgi:hypothetical protein
MAGVYVVKHRVCGHIGGVGTSRDQGEEMLRLLQATGNHGWRLQAVTGSAGDVDEVARAIATDEKCDTCRVRLPDNVKIMPGGVAVNHGVRVEATEKAHAGITDPGPGLHLWIVVSSYRVVPVEAGRYELDHENLLSVDGPGCFKCERSWSPEVAAAPCDGSVDV